ncbi:MAG: hypothetical protein RIT24_3303, partial [Planctomycetota bacterium]
MSDALGPGDDKKRLPAELEDEVLAALEGDDASRDTAIANILQREPGHAGEIRRWLQEAGAMPGDTKASAPATIGPWRVLRLLGRGGFGAVYLTESDAGAQAAVKVVNDGVNSREVLRRFAAEREALLRLDHVGIARLLDVGETEAGRPWFAMEYVAGSSLLTHCRRARLPIRKRVELFLRAVDAVTHAHQRGILHRDLSANNVLVAGEGEEAQPKIIDFGIAKSLRGAPLADGGLTFQATVMGTPEYMSPEQAFGEPGSVDTRSDVYSLGAQLYELLTDALPVPSEALRAQGPLGIAEALRSHEAKPPSAVAPPQLRRALRGDLDAIVLRAIAKDRDERYATAAEFGADLRRHLANEPVLAARTNAWYVMVKYARRHRARFALMVLLALSAALGMVAAFDQWQEARASRERQRAELEDLEARSEAGFQLLADQQRLLRAIDEERMLVPAWPSRTDAMRAWLAERAEPLRQSLQQIDQQSERLRASNDRTERARHLAMALDRMRADTLAFLGPEGPVARLERKLRFAQACADRLATEQEAWRQMDEAMRARRGFSLTPQPGLSPLGPDPSTGLFEFLDLATHGHDVPPPHRGKDGSLALSPTSGIVFVLIQRATARLGAQRTEQGLDRFDADAQTDEIDGRSAVLDDYLIAKTELTRAQWSRLVGAPLEGRPDDPQTEVSWEDCAATLGVFGMDLPTEAQWEHACRAGTGTPWWTGSSLEALGEAAQFGPSMQAVARLRANAFGLHDVHGNAAEWCKDGKHNYSVATPRARDGLLVAPAPIRMPELRSVRGGSAPGGPMDARSAARGGRIPSAKDPYLG